MKKTIAWFKAGFGVDVPGEYREINGAEYVPTYWIRVTEYVEVEFPELLASTVVEKQLEQINKAELEAREEFQQKLNEFADRRAKLQALTHSEA